MGEINITQISGIIDEKLKAVKRKVANGDYNKPNIIENSVNELKMFNVLGLP